MFRTKPRPDLYQPLPARCCDHTVHKYPEFTYTLGIHRLIIVVSPPCKVTNPWNNERITKLSCDSKDTICAKTTAAADHQGLWSQRTMQERIALVLEAARLLKADAKGLAPVRQQDGRGTPLYVPMCIDTIIFE